MFCSPATRFADHFLLNCELQPFIFLAPQLTRVLSDGYEDMLPIELTSVTMMLTRAN